jgi:hypothetical protein
VQTSFAYDGTAFIQTDLSEAVLDFVGVIIRHVKDILAKAFNRYCADIGYEDALPVIRKGWQMRILMCAEQ